MRLRKTVTVCDVCRDEDRPTTAYAISSQGRRTNVDLCTEHEKPLQALLEGRSGGGHKVLTPADVSRIKKR